MSLALEAISPPADYLLIDHLRLQVPLPQYSLPKGDALVLSIAAASIVAKVSRDRMMIELDEQLPGYGFAQHKGYGTAQHQAALAELGPSPVHRLSFEPLRWLVDQIASGSAKAAPPQLAEAAHPCRTPLAPHLPGGLARNTT